MTGVELVTRNPLPLVRGAANESEGVMSPDGKWLAYYSDQSGVGGVYLRSFANPTHVSDAVRTVSSANALEPRWRADGKELFYLERVGSLRRYRVVAVPFSGASANPLGTPQALFEFGGLHTVQQANVFSYAPSPDGQRFLVNAYAADPQPSLDVFVNWRPGK